MATRKSTIFYGFLVAFGSLVVGMVIAARLDLTPGSFADTLRIPATNSAPLAGAIDATTFRTIAHDAGPAVVSIRVKLTANPTGLEGFLGQLMPGSPQNGAPNGNGRRRGLTPAVPSEPQVEEGDGSGFIIDRAGFILTNNHVVEDATSIEVHLSTMNDADDGLPAKVIARDPLVDIALIQLTELPKTPLTEARFGDSDQMAPGDWVMAIGNPFRLSNTVTVGVVSAVGRETESQFARPQEMIQTDAAINRGNSGGPLLNIRGEVIGINTMIVTDGMDTGNLGVGFAVPINTVRDLLPQLRQGKVTHGKLGVGIAPRPLTPDYAADLGLPDANGVEVDSFQDGSPAKAAGMKMGDVIVEFNGKPVKGNSDLVRMVTATAPGTTVPVVVYRDKKRLTLNVKIDELDLTQEVATNTNDQPSPAPRGRAPQPTDTAFGMTIQDLSPADRRTLGGRAGVLVTSVTPFGSAAESGLQEGDVIESIQGQAVSSVADATPLLNAVQTGRTARLVVLRTGPDPSQPPQESLLQLRKR